MSIMSAMLAASGRWRFGRVMAMAAGCSLLLGLGGCSQVSYYAQSINGHFTMLHEAKPVSDLLADPSIDPPCARGLSRRSKFAATPCLRSASRITAAIALMPI